MSDPVDDHIPFPSATGYAESEWGAYRAAAFALAVRWAQSILAVTPVADLASEDDAQRYAIAEAERQLGRRLDVNEELMALYAMRQAWRQRPAPLALVPEVPEVPAFDLLARAEAEAADWSDLMREVI